MSLNAKRLLGLRLEDAAALMKAEGITPKVLVSTSPRCTPGEGLQRVVRVRDNELTVCGFQAADPQ